VALALLISASQKDTLFMSTPSVKAHNRRRKLRSAPSFPSRNGEKRVEGLTRSELLLKYGTKVRWIAQRISNGLPQSVDIEDLVSVGFIGLMDAADKFDPSENVKFSTYAEFRIRGSMLDELRKQDWVPRRVRSQIKAIDKVEAQVETETGRKATHEDVTKKLGITRDQYQEVKHEIGSLMLVPYGTVDEVSDLLQSGDETNPYIQASQKDTRQHIENIFRQALSDEERTVMSCYYFRGLNLREIGAILSLTESRISQLHAQAIRKLKGEIKTTSANAMFLMLLDTA
jgi:RNA polymerase sigma factor for flagellar operon FliA